MKAALILAAVALATSSLAHGAEAEPIAMLAAVTPAATLASHTAADSYADQLRQVLQKVQHYPNSREARQLRPQGTARVWLEIDRSGRLLGAGIAESSSIALLDSEALLAVRRASYPAFAGNTSAASRRFVVPVEFFADGAN